VTTTGDRTVSRAMPDVVPAEARHLQGKRAGLVSRIIANLLDLGVVVGVLIGIYVAWCGVKLLWQRKDFTFPTPSFGQAFIAGAIVLVLYFTTAWTASGRTYGDRLMGLRVVDHAGRRVRLGRSFLRALLCWIFPIGLLWAAVSRENRSVQDLIVRTSVRYEWGLGTKEQSLEAPRSADPLDARVDVQPAVADEPDDRHPEPLPRLDGE
jgi:uncharacterized RDD family membrane protein YckC